MVTVLLLMTVANRNSGCVRHGTLRILSKGRTQAALFYTWKNGGVLDFPKSFVSYAANFHLGGAGGIPGRMDNLPLPETKLRALCPPQTLGPVKENLTRSFSAPWETLLCVLWSVRVTSKHYLMRLSCAPNLDDGSLEYQWYHSFFVICYQFNYIVFL